MSGSNVLQGVAFSGLTPTPVATDNDTTLLFQGGLFRQISVKAQIGSYTPAGAVLLAAGGGASRGAAVGAVPAGDPMQAVALASTLAMTPAAQPGGAPVLGAVVGTTQGTVAAGNDPRIAAAAQVDNTGSLHLPGSSFSLGGGVFVISTDLTGHVTISGAGVTLLIPLPFVDPLVLGAWWNNGGLIAVSGGP